MIHSARSKSASCSAVEESLRVLRASAFSVPVVMEPALTEVEGSAWRRAVFASSTLAGENRRPDRSPRAVRRSASHYGGRVLKKSD